MFLQRLAVLLGGFAAGSLLRQWRSQDAAASRRSLDRLSREWKAQSRSHERRLSQLEAESAGHQSRLDRMPSTTQLLAAMDDLLGKAMSGLEGRLTAQARSIEALQLTVTQTDELLERVLESLDTLRDSPRNTAPE